MLTATYARPARQVCTSIRGPESQLLIVADRPRWTFSESRNTLRLPWVLCSDRLYDLVERACTFQLSS